MLLFVTSFLTLSGLYQSESELIHFFESRFLDESEVIHSWECTNLYVCRVRFPSFWGRRVLLAQRLDIHKRISGVFPRPPRCSCVTIVTQMTLMTLVWGYPYTISQIQRHQRHLRHSDFAFLVISLFLFRAVVNCKRHFAISVTVVTVITVFVGQGKGVYQKHRHYRQHCHSTGKPF